MGDATTAELLAFLMPGVQHELGNALFKIRGHAQVMGAESLESARGEILAASDRAGDLLGVLQCLGRGADTQPPVAIQGLLGRLLDVARVPLRERGLRVRDPGSSGVPQSLCVDGVLATIALTGALRAVAEVVPDGCGGSLVAALDTAEDHARVSLRVTFGAGQLPFPLDLDAAAASVAAVDERVTVEVGDALVVVLPAVVGARHGGSRDGTV